MKKVIYSLFGLFLLGTSQLLYGQNESGVIHCDSYSLSKPLSELIAEEQANIKKIEKRAQKTRLKELESKDKKHREPQKFLFSEEKDGAAYGTDPSLIQTTDGTRPGPSQRINIAGVNANMAPHDPSGAPGLNHYIQATNSTSCRIINKTTGATVSNFQMGTLWNPDTPNDGDPIVMYDKYANRWFLAQFGSTGNKIFIAVSTTSDPLGTWSCYTFSSPQFPDYLKFSIWQDGYYMTSNQNTQKVFAFERTEMLAGNPTARSVYATFNPPDGGGFFCPLSADADGNGGLPPAGTACPIMSYSDNAWGGGAIDGIQIYQMAVNWVPAVATATISFVSAVATSSFDGSYNASWNDIAQPGTTQKLDGIGGVLMYRAQYRYGSAGYNTVVLSWPVKISSTQRSIMWAELRQNQGTGVWSVYQQQIYAPDTYYRWMGSISMDDAGNIGLCYAKSGSATVFPSLAYTGRLSTDPLNTMTFTETIAAAGTVSQSTSWYGGNRFGDYAHTTLDPDGSTFWHTGEYLAGTASDPKKTRVYSFAFILPTDALVSITSSDADNSICVGSSITFTAVPTNGGTSPIYQWYVSGSPVGTNSATYTTSGLTTGQVVTCVMTSDMPGVTNNPATSNGITTTVTAPVTPTVSIIGNSTVCAGSLASFILSASNSGSTPTYQWTVNGVNVGTSSSSYSYTPTSGDVIGATLTSSNTCVTSSTANASPITMTVNPTPATPTISQNTNILTSSSASGNQWYLNGTLISGATNQVYTATLNGTYTVVVTTGGCPSAASTGVVINGIAAIVELDPYVFSIFPNPSQGDFSVSFKADLSEVYKLKVFNAAGQLVYEDAIDNQNGQIVKSVQLGKVASGTYNVTLSNGQIESSKKIIVKRD